MRRALDRGLPDVLVTDVVLPDGNGLDAVAGFVRDHPRLPVIVLSAQNTLTTAVRATEVGAYDYLPKPFDLDRERRNGRQRTRSGMRRSEEHTSELQSLMRNSYAVFCLKKKNKYNTSNNKVQK